MRKRTAPAVHAGPTHVAVRVDPETLVRVDALIPKLSQRWHRATRSDVLRFIIDEGLATIEARAKRAAKKGGAS